MDTYPLRNMALPSSLEKVQLATTASTVPEGKIKMIAIGTKMKTGTMSSNKPLRKEFNTRPTFADTL